MTAETTLIKLLDAFTKQDHVEALICLDSLQHIVNNAGKLPTIKTLSLPVFGSVEPEKLTYFMIQEHDAHSS